VAKDLVAYIKARGAEGADVPDTRGKIRTFLGNCRAFVEKGI
jgi:hypothetical protein